MTAELNAIENVLIKEMNNKLIYDDLINPTKLEINKRSEIDKLLIYTTIGKDKSYLKLLETFCESLCYTNLASKHLLVICDLSFHSDVYEILSKYAFLTFHILDVEDTLTPEEASSNKLNIFNFKDIYSYNYCIYVDLDCCFLNNLDYLFTKPIDDGLLYVFPEFDDTNQLFSSPYFAVYNNETKYLLLTTKQIERIKEQKKKPFNAGLFLFKITNTMASYFKRLQSFIDNHSDKFHSYYEQSFMNTFFNVNNITCYDLFTNKNVIMNTTPSKIINNNTKLIHYNFFTGFENSGKYKGDAVKLFINEFQHTNKYSFITFDNRHDMIHALVPPNGVMIEIGVFESNFSDDLLSLNPRRIYLVDCWTENESVGSGDVDGNNYREHKNAGDLYKVAKSKYEYNPLVKIVRKLSYEFLDKLKDNSIDAIYIDGDHSYEGVKKDLESAYSKIKRFGWIMGHDYEMNMSKAKKEYFFGVRKAVDEFCEKYNLKIFAKAMDGCVSYAILKY